MIGDVRLEGEVQTVLRTAFNHKVARISFFLPSRSRPAPHSPTVRELCGLGSALLGVRGANSARGALNALRNKNVRARKAFREACAVYRRCRPTTSLDLRQGERRQSVADPARVEHAKGRDSKLR